MNEVVGETTEIAVKMIRLADGTLIDPLTRKPVNSQFKNAPREPGPDDNEDPDVPDDDDPELPLEIEPLARRSLHDLTLNRHQMAVVNNVLVYTLWGLPDDEIAIQCNCTTDDVRAVRNLDEYGRMHEALTDGLQAALANSVQGILAKAAPRAARGIVHNLKSKSGDIKLAAQKDILDRAGHRPVDRVEHHHKFAVEGLTIRVVKDSELGKIPTMDLTDA